MYIVRTSHLFRLGLVSFQFVVLVLGLISYLFLLNQNKISKACPFFAVICHA